MYQLSYVHIYSQLLYGFDFPFSGKTESSTWSDLVVCGNSFVELLRTKTLHETVLQKKMLQYPGTWLGEKQWLTKVTLFDIRQQHIVESITLLKLL